jgi:hypothetical protein
MSQTIVFVQVQGRPGILEFDLSESATFGELLDKLGGAGISVDAETFIFIDEAGAPAHGQRHETVPDLKRGSRIHVSRCRNVNATVHFVEKTIEREFAPGVRLRAVKAWAVHEFKIDHKDAAEHVLQICNSTKRPASDTPLQELTNVQACEVCFDLVPEKRVEG